MNRTYRSPRGALQARQTRAAVLVACRALFAERGWAATGVRDIDDGPVPLAERPIFLDLGEGSLAERTAAAAALVTDIHVRTIGLQRALREGAGGNPAPAELLATQEENRRASTGQGMALVLRRAIGVRERDLSGRKPAPRSSTRS